MNFTKKFLCVWALIGAVCSARAADQLTFTPFVGDSVALKISGMSLGLTNEGSPYVQIEVIQEVCSSGSCSAYLRQSVSSIAEGEKLVNMIKASKAARAIVSGRILRPRGYLPVAMSIDL